MYEKHKNISLIISLLNLSFFKDLIGIIFLTIITKFTYEMVDNYYLKIILVLSSIILLLLLAYIRHKLLVEFILIKVLKSKKLNKFSSEKKQDIRDF